MEIKVLGTGCAKCKTTYQTIEKVISENNLDVTPVSYTHLTLPTSDLV